MPDRDCAGDAMEKLAFEILRQTGCQVNQHAWTWTSGGTVQIDPQEYDLCCCGRYQWRDREKAAREACADEEQR